MLGERLRGAYGSLRDLLVLGLPRGGVPVAFEVARKLGAPLDVFVVRKLGVPGYEELAMGAIASGGVRVLNDALVSEFGMAKRRSPEQPPSMARSSAPRTGVSRRTGALDVAGRTVIVVDDGLATGSTMRAAALAVAAQEPKPVVVAVPVAAERTCDEFRADVDEIVCALTPEPFRAVGLWYDDFSPTSDDEVSEVLDRARAVPAP